MSPIKAAKFSLEPLKSSTPQWLQGICVGFGLFAIGNWGARQYGTGWTSNRVIDYIKTSIGDQTTGVYDSTLTEPWSKVSHPVQSIRDRCCLSARILRYHCIANQLQIIAAEPLLRSSQVKSSNTVNASTTSNALVWIFPWIGTIPSSATLALGSP